MKLLSINLYCLIGHNRTYTTSVTVKLKVKAEFKFYPKSSLKAQGGREIYIHPFFYFVCKCSGWLTPHPGRLTPGKDPVPIVQNAELTPGPVWTGAKNLAPPGIQSPDLRSVESRYTTISVLRAIYCFRLAVRKDFMNTETLRVVFRGVGDTARIQGVPGCMSGCLVSRGFQTWVQYIEDK